MITLSISSLLLGGVTGYLVGSIPFAYLITKSKTGMDVRRHGSGNVGAMNSYEVTGKKSIGGYVLAADLVKGLVPVLLFEILGLYDVLPALIPALVLGHCYPVWLRFHGGRGLATAAGAMLVVNPLLLLTWLVGFVIFWTVRKNVHFASVIPTLICLAVVLIAPASFIDMGTMAFSGFAREADTLRVSVSLLLLIIFARLYAPFMAHVKGWVAR